MTSIQPELSPEDQARMDAAQKDESATLTEAMTGFLQSRVVQLNVEVRLRDERILELEQELAAERQAGSRANG